MRFAAILFIICLGAPACSGPGARPVSQAPASTPAAKGPPAGTPAPGSPAAGAPDQQQQLVSGVRDVVAEVLGIAPAEVDVGAPLAKQKVPADDLDTVEIVMKVEETFGVEIPDEEISGPDGEVLPNLSVKKLAEIVAAKKSRK